MAMRTNVMGEICCEWNVRLKCLVISAYGYTLNIRDTLCGRSPSIQVDKEILAAHPANKARTLTVQPSRSARQHLREFPITITITNLLMWPREPDNGSHPTTLLHQTMFCIVRYLCLQQVYNFHVFAQEDTVLWDALFHTCTTSKSSQEPNSDLNALFQT